MREQTRALQRDYGFAVSDERAWGIPGGSPNGAEVRLRNDTVQIVFTLDRRISHVTADIGLARCADDLGRRYSTEMIVRFAGGDPFEELGDAKRGVGMATQLDSHIGALARHGRELLLGDEKTFELLGHYANGYHTRYTEEAQHPIAVRQEKKGRGSRVVFFIVGGLIGALVVLLAYGHLRF